MHKLTCAMAMVVAFSIYNGGQAVAESRKTQGPGDATFLDPNGDLGLGNGVSAKIDKSLRNANLDLLNDPTNPVAIDLRQNIQTSTYKKGMAIIERDHLNDIDWEEIMFNASDLGEIMKEVTAVLTPVYRELYPEGGEKLLEQSLGPIRKEAKFYLKNRVIHGRESAVRTFVKRLQKRMVGKVNGAH